MAHSSNPLLGACGGRTGEVEQDMTQREYRVGELARKASLTVRTLHHWEEVGLLEPSRRTEAGHRLYGPEAVARLQKIRSLKAVGMGLDEIRQVLDREGPGLDRILRQHRERLRDQIRVLDRLDRRLERVLDILDREEGVPEDELLELMEMMTAVERHFTSEQMEVLAAREETLGPEAIQAAQAEWPVLIAKMREEMEKGTDPASPEVQALARRWRELVEAFTGGDPEIEASLKHMYRQEPQVAASQGLSEELFQFLGRAMEGGA